MLRTASGRELSGGIGAPGEEYQPGKAISGVCAFLSNHKEKKGGLYKYPASKVLPG